MLRDAGYKTAIVGKWQRSEGQLRAAIARAEGLPREWIFCHYDPRWLKFIPARYAQDKRYKLYGDGALYDYRQDPLENSPLPQTSLTPAQDRSRQKLQSALDSLK